MKPGKQISIPFPISSQHLFFKSKARIFWGNRAQQVVNAFGRRRNKNLRLCQLSWIRNNLHSSVSLEALWGRKRKKKIITVIIGTSLDDNHKEIMAAFREKITLGWILLTGLLRVSAYGQFMQIESTTVLSFWSGRFVLDATTVILCCPK